MADQGMVICVTEGIPGPTGPEGPGGPDSTAHRFPTEALAAAAVIAPTPNVLETFGYNTVGDGGAAKYQRVVSSPYVWKFASQDGAQWEQVEKEIDLRSTSLKWDNPDYDNSPILDALIQDAALTHRKLVCRMPGTLYFCQVDAATNGHVMLDFTPGVKLHALPNWLEAGSGHSAGDPVVGSALTVRGGVPGGNRAYEFHAKHLYIDVTQAGGGSAGTFGTALSVSNWNFVYTENYRAYAGTDYRGVLDPDTGIRTPHGDSGITQTTVNNSMHVNMWCRGFPDLGLYISGDPPLPGHSGDDGFADRGGHMVLNPVWMDCASGMKSQRGSRRLRLFGGQAIRCGYGLHLHDMSGAAADGLTDDYYFNCWEFVVTGFQIKKCLAGIKVGPGQRGSLIGCQVEDWGYQPIDGTLESGTTGSTRAAYSLEGASQTHWTGCRAWFRDWDPIDEGDVDRWLFGFRCKPFTNSQGQLFETTENIFEGCMIEGANRAYYEEGLSTNNRGVIYARGGADKGIQLAPGSSSQVIDGDTLINNSTARTADANLAMGTDSARINLLRGARTADRLITWPDLNTTMWGKEFHFTNETTGEFSTIITQVEGGDVTLHSGEWCDVVWNGTSLRLLRQAAFVIRARVTLDFPVVINHTIVTTSIAGAEVGNTVLLGLPSDGGGSALNYNAWVSAADTVSVQANNWDPDNPIDPGARLFHITVFKG